MNRMCHAGRWLCLVVNVLQLQSTLRRAAIDAYSIPTSTKKSCHILQRTVLCAAKTVKKPISPKSDLRSRTKRVNQSESQLQDIENPTITLSAARVVAADVETTSTTSKAKKRSSKKVDAVAPKVGVNQIDKNKNVTENNILESSISTPTHWIVDTDRVIYQEISVAANVSDINDDININTTTSTTLPSVFHCTIRGNPLPLRRHRTRLGFIYNPSAATQLTFRTLVLQIMDSLLSDRNRTTTSPTFSMHNLNGHPVTAPLWNIEQPIAVSIVFRMKRPNSHFIGNKPIVQATTKSSRKNVTAASRLRPSAPKVMCTTSMRTDVDNLAKFVLDSLNNVTYVDDKQIVSLHVIKLFDNDVTNRYQGSTTITIRLLHDDDMTTHLMEQQQQILSTATTSLTYNNNMY